MNHKFCKPLVQAGLCLLLAVMLPGSALAQDGVPPLQPTPEPADEPPQAPVPDEQLSEIHAEGFEAADLLVIQSTGITTRISLDSSGIEGNNRAIFPAICANGRYVAFTSAANNLVVGDTNGQQDIFVHDRSTGATTRVSLHSDGTQGNETSRLPSISADGRYVAFESWASNLVVGDTNGKVDIFVHDRNTGATTRVSLDSLGAQANDNSYDSMISADGLFVAFTSDASNLVSGDTYGYTDTFVHDTQTGATTRISVNSLDGQANDASYYPSISADGRFVAFNSYASNLVNYDFNGKVDIFVHDRSTGATTRVSLHSDGTQSNNDSFDKPSISADGRYVAFNSYASNLVVGDTNNMQDIFVHDRSTGVTTRVSLDSLGAQANSGSGYPSISADGHYVAFQSTASNLVVGDTNGVADIFMHDHSTGATTRVSLHSAGSQANSGSGYPSISADGRYVAFESDASNLVNGDTNVFTDIFVHDRLGIKTTTFVSPGAYDGWVLESARTSNKGGSLNKGAATLSVGDDAKNRQYRGILHFNTATLPDNAVITAVKLQVKRAGYKGTYPFNTHGALYVDLRKGAFSGNNALQLTDWQAAASKLLAGKIPKTNTNKWHTLNLAAANLKFINKKGVTQLRLRFKKQDNGDNGADTVNFYSGNATAANRPKLIITYYVP